MRFRFRELLSIGKSVSDNTGAVRQTIFSNPLGQMNPAFGDIPIESSGFFKDPIHKTLRRKNEESVTGIR